MFAAMKRVELFHLRVRQDHVDQRGRQEQVGYLVVLNCLHDCERVGLRQQNIGRAIGEHSHGIDTRSMRQRSDYQMYGRNLVAESG